MFFQFFFRCTVKGFFGQNLGQKHEHGGWFFSEISENGVIRTPEPRSIFPSEKSSVLTFGQNKGVGSWLVLGPSAPSREPRGLRPLDPRAGVIFEFFEPFGLEIFISFFLRKNGDMEWEKSHS